METPVLILDNGAYMIKAGVSGVDVEPQYVVFNNLPQLICSSQS